MVPKTLPDQDPAWSRRRWLRSAASLGVTAGVGGAVAAWPAGPARAASPSGSAAGSTAPLPLFDAHLHYSHDAWEVVPPKQAAQILRAAGLKGALVSSSDDEGTQKLLAEAPDIVVPELRPYRTRGDLSTWVRDDGIVTYLEGRLAKFRYVGIGEFHLYGADAELPVPRRMVQLARERGLLLHAHSDADAVERLFAQWPQARVLWAHSGFEPPARVREVLRRHRQLWCDLAFRSDHGASGKVEAGWREAFEEFPERFMPGTDTFTPERWHYVVPHARWTREWLADLPAPLAERIAWRNGQDMLAAVRGAPGYQGHQTQAGVQGNQGNQGSQAAKAPQGCDGGAPGALMARGSGEAAGLSVRFAPRDGRLAVGRHFELAGTVCGAARLLRVDADMPAHRHGMNYRPTFSTADAGAFEARGLMLHMPGIWRFRFELEREGGRRVWVSAETDVR